ncbi:MAG: DegQ family serine endoprotease [Dongiaceae bacterium]
MAFPGLLLALVLGLAPPAPAAAQTVPDSRAEMQLSFAPLVKRVAPAVVNIYAKQVVQAQAVSPLFADPFFQRFFGQGFGEGRPVERVQNSLGSGVIVAPDGLIVTNHHVVQDAREITVVLHDGREFPARMVADSERVDLALLRIDTKGRKLPALELGDSDKLEVGDLVLAIGDPFGVGQTVTSGIVSALARTQVGINDYGFFIQTDAAINPGNSGGALVSMDGRLVGINTAIYSRSGGSIGIGFAIPANMVGTVIAAERNGGKLVTPWIGAGGQALTADLAASLSLERPGGVIISNIYRGGPADRAGLKVGDVVTAINGREVADAGALRFRLATQPIGSTADLTVIRKGREITLQLPLAPAPETPPRQATKLRGDQPLQGATVVNLSPAVAEELGLDEWSGVVITEIAPGAFPLRLGLQPGDIIVKLNDKPIGSVADLKEALDKPVERWAITFKRAGQVRTLLVS